MHNLPSQTTRPTAAGDIKRRSALAVAAVSALAVTGCSAAPSGDAESAPPAKDADWPRTVETKKGKVTLNKKPTRIVSTSMTLTGTLLAIGAPVVASGATSPNSPISDSQGFFTQWGGIAKQRGVKSLYSGKPNIEAILAEKPDLIIVSSAGNDSAVDQFNRLKSIAPTIVLSYDDSSWQELATVLGRATGHEDDAADVIANFRSALTDAKSRIALPPHPTSALVYHDDGSGVFWTKKSAQGRLLTGLGFTLAEVPDSAAARSTMGKRSDIVQASAENLHSAAAGKSIVLVSATPKTKKAFESNPTMKDHPAVTGNHVVVTDPDSFRLDYYSSVNMIDTLVKQLG